MTKIKDKDSTKDSEIIPKPLDDDFAGKDINKNEVRLPSDPELRHKAYYKTKLLMSCYVAGVGYHDIEDQWDELYIGKELALIRQHNNEHDVNAIAVALDDEYDGDSDNYDFDYILGYVPKNCNKQIASMLDMGWQNAFVTKISELNENSSYDKRLKINIFIKSKAAVEMSDASVELRILNLDDKEYGELKDALWSKGNIKYRWGGYPDITMREFFPNVGDKIVFIHKEGVTVKMYLMNVTSIGEDEGEYVDDCTDYTLTNVVGPLTVPDSELTFFEDESYDNGLHPSMPLSPNASEQLLNMFREAIHHQFLE